MKKRRKVNQADIEPFVVTECVVQRGNNIYNDTVLVTADIAKGRKRFGFVTSNRSEGNVSLTNVQNEPVDERVKVLTVRGCTFGILAKLTGFYPEKTKPSNSSNYFNPEL